MPSYSGHQSSGKERGTHNRGRRTSAGEGAGGWRGRQEKRREDGDKEGEGLVDKEGEGRGRETRERAGSECGNRLKETESTTIDQLTVAKAIRNSATTL